MITITEVITPTDEVLAGMMVENSGRSILDSGGVYGRHWEKNAGMTAADWLKSPRVTVDDKWGDVTLSTFHHLSDCLTYEPKLDAMFSAFSALSDEGYLQDIEDFIKIIGAKSDWSANSYNGESNLSQVIQYHVFTIGEESGYVALQIHGGADVRGGYTKPRIFRMDDDCAIISENITISCTEDRQHYLDTRGGGEWTDHSGNYGETPYSLHERAKDRGVEGIACPEEDCSGILHA